MVEERALPVWVPPEMRLRDPWKPDLGAVRGPKPLLLQVSPLATGWCRGASRKGWVSGLICDVDG